MENPILPKKRARPFFPYESKALRRVFALAHNFVHKKCEETDSAEGAESGRRPAKFFIGKIYLIKINNLPCGKAISHKFIHRNCGQVSLSQEDFVAYWKSLDQGAMFLRMEKYPLRIKELACRWQACAHFYPQKVCRTLLAAKRATRYIAEFVHV
ncbi:hypothetical protein AB4Z32_23575 [Massilia sp. 2TAF26]|uniref:hypothetical protein n=1 Tax=Massilia sp. 2TAF26 TaxID=3233012 RepID=UPI003F979748